MKPRIERLKPVLELYAQRYQQQEIAERLNVSQTTVSQTLTKNGINHRTVLGWVREGLTVQQMLDRVRSPVLPFPSKPKDQAEPLPKEWFEDCLSGGGFEHEGIPPKISLDSVLFLFVIIALIVAAYFLGLGVGRGAI